MKLYVVEYLQGAEMSIFEEISDWILKIRLANKKKAVSKQPSVTYNDKERDECIFKKIINRK